MIRPVEAPGFPAPVSAIPSLATNARYWAFFYVMMVSLPRFLGEGDVWTQNSSKPGSAAILSLSQRHAKVRRIQMNSHLSHFDENGASRMVDVGDKDPTERIARASGRVRMAPETLQLIREGRAAKGDVLEVARLAGIMAAKRTGDLIPLCHPLALDAVKVDFDFPSEDMLAISSQVCLTAKTGVEMEALVSVTIAALTVYDMCKAVDRGMVIESVQLEEKSGGRSGHYVRAPE